MRSENRVEPIQLPGDHLPAVRTRERRSISDLVERGTGGPDVEPEVDRSGLLDHLSDDVAE